MPFPIFHRLPFPRSLRRQFLLATSILASLILMGSLIAIYAMRESMETIRKLSEERLVHMQDAQDVMQHTLAVERGMQKMMIAGSHEGVTNNYDEIQGQLEEVDRIARRLGTSSDDALVLALYQSGQLFRNTIHIVVRLREGELQAETSFSQTLYRQSASLQETGEPGTLALALILHRLRDANDSEQIESLREYFVRQAGHLRELPREVLGDMRKEQAEAADSDARPTDNLFLQRLRLVRQRAALRRFHAELQRHATDMVASASELSGHFSADYRGAIMDLAEASRNKQQWVLALLGASLCLAWLGYRYFLGRHVLARLQQVSLFLRQGKADGKHPGVPVQGDDEIGEMARAVEQFLNEREQLAETNKEFEEFTYSISHDLRVPLRAIDGFSHLLLDEHASMLDEEGKRLLNVIRDNTRRMGQFIDDMLQFFRAGRREMHLADVDMEKLAHEVVEELRPDFAGGRLQLEIGPVPHAVGDRAMLHQVFANLLSNAIKFSRHKENPRIQVGGSAETGEAVYFVKDNGAGFEMQYVGKLFGVFQRLHGVEEFEGSGIGLAVVKRIVTRHGGRVWAEGKPGEGATMYFALPVSDLTSTMETS